MQLEGALLTMGAVNTPAPTQEQRLEIRIPLDTISLPFLGFHEQGGFAFQFFLMDASPNGLQVNIPEWVTAWNRLDEGDEVLFSLPLTAGGKLLHQGHIRWTRHARETRETRYGAILTPPLVRNAPTAFVMTRQGEITFQGPDDTHTLKDFCAATLKDAALLKKGILIYLDHLMPYFSRLTENPDEYPELRGILFSELRREIELGARTLKDLAERVAAAPDFLAGFADYYDLETLRRLLEPTLPVQILRSAFEKERILAYLEEVHRLELRSFVSYNVLVLAQTMLLEQASPSPVIPPTV